MIFTTKSKCSFIKTRPTEFYQNRVAKNYLILFYFFAIYVMSYFKIKVEVFLYIWSNFLRSCLCLNLSSNFKNSIFFSDVQKSLNWRSFEKENILPRSQDTFWCEMSRKTRARDKLETDSSTFDGHYFGLFERQPIFFISCDGIATTRRGGGGAFVGRLRRSSDISATFRVTLPTIYELGEFCPYFFRGRRVTKQDT